MAARGPNLAHHSIFSGPQNYSENTFESEISSNFATSPILLFPLESMARR